MTVQRGGEKRSIYLKSHCTEGFVNGKGGGGNDRIS